MILYKWRNKFPFRGTLLRSYRLTLGLVSLVPIDVSRLWWLLRLSVDSVAVTTDSIGSNVCLIRFKVLLQFRHDSSLAFRFSVHDVHLGPFFAGNVYLNFKREKFFKTLDILLFKCACMQGYKWWKSSFLCTTRFDGFAMKSYSCCSREICFSAKGNMERDPKELPIEAVGSDRKTNECGAKKVRDFLNQVNTTHCKTGQNRIEHLTNPFYGPSRLSFFCPLASNGALFYGPGSGIYVKNRPGCMTRLTHSFSETCIPRGASRWARDTWNANRQCSHRPLLIIPSALADWLVFAVILCGDWIIASKNTRRGGCWWERRINFGN